MCMQKVAYYVRDRLVIFIHMYRLSEASRDMFVITYFVREEKANKKRL